MGSKCKKSCDESQTSSQNATTLVFWLSMILIAGIIICIIGIIWWFATTNNTNIVKYYINGNQLIPYQGYPVYQSPQSFQSPQGPPAWNVVPPSNIPSNLKIPVPAGDLQSNTLVVSV